MKGLFVCYGGGHVEMCLPVMRALRQRVPACDLQLMALTTAARAARQAGETPLGYADFLPGPEAAAVQAWGERMLPGNQHPDVDRAESVAYLGLNFQEWVTERGEEGAWAHWQAVGRHGFLPVRFFTRVLRQLRPDVVVSTNSPRSEQAVVAAAAALGIPSLSMVDLFGLPGDPFLARPVQADCITVLSEGVKGNLVRAGIAAQRIVVTGNPAFDVLSRPEAVAEGQAWRAARGWQGRHVVLWASHREPLDAEPAWAGTALGDTVLRQLVQWVERHEDVTLAVRCHPNEWQDFERPPQHPRLHWSQPGQEALTPVLLGSDQVVVQGTTVGVQAYTAGKRLVSLGFSPMVRRTGMDYGALGMALRADSLQDLERLLDEGVRLGLDRSHAVPAMSRAAEAVAGEIERLAARAAPLPQEHKE